MFIGPHTILQTEILQNYEEECIISYKTNIRL